MGAICGDDDLANEWADRLLSLLRESWARALVQQEKTDEAIKRFDKDRRLNSTRIWAARRRGILYLPFGEVGLSGPGGVWQDVVVGYSVVGNGPPRA